MPFYAYQRAPKLKRPDGKSDMLFTTESLTYIISP